MIYSNFLSTPKTGNQSTCPEFFWYIENLDKDVICNVSYDTKYYDIYYEAHVEFFDSKLKKPKFVENFVPSEDDIQLPDDLVWDSAWKQELKPRKEKKTEKGLVTYSFIKIRPDLYKHGPFGDTNNILDTNSVDVLIKNLNGIELGRTRAIESTEKLLTDLNNLYRSELFIGSRCTWVDYSDIDSMSIPYIITTPFEADSVDANRERIVRIRDEYRQMYK